MPKPKPSAMLIDDEPPTVDVGPPAGKREEAVRAAILHALGRPPELLRVTVAPLWSDHFRVNVFTGSSGGVSIPNSYFVTADAAGTILRASPPIEKQY
jgi:hypothetical protein